MLALDVESPAAPEVSYPPAAVVVPGLYKPGEEPPGSKIWSAFRFEDYLRDMSQDPRASIDRAPIDLAESYNMYTVGRPARPGECASVPGLEGNSHFMNPFCRLANAWFGVQLIIDDAGGKGRRFMLKSPEGPPADLANLRPEALVRLTEMDQKLIVWLSHTGQKDYGWNQFQKEFQFEVDSVTVTSEALAFGGAPSLRVRFSARTTAAAPDPSLVTIPKGYFFDFVGLPTKAIFQHVAPWYPVTLRAETYARYVTCHPDRGLWAVLYFNGATIRTKQGKVLDHWKDLRPELEKMAAHVKICGK